MTSRSSEEAIVFGRPFSLPELDAEQPAGSYTVRTDEELLEGVSFLAYRRVATVIMIPLGRGRSIEAVAVDYHGLQAALAKDRRTV